MTSNQERLEKIRAELNARNGGKKQTDPTQWRLPKATKDQNLSFKFIVLPPLEPDAACASGKAKTDMKGLYSYRVGLHWIGEAGTKRPYTCPRMHDGSNCAYCSQGFALMNETEDSEQRKMIRKTFMPSEVHAVNVYFPNVKSNPPELRDKVKWVEISQRTITDRFNECLGRNETDATGETEEETQAWGFFYEPEESYHFLLNIVQKGEWNDYAGSRFIPSTRGPIVRTADGTLDKAKMNEILHQRIDLATKYSTPDNEKLKSLLNITRNPPAAAEADDVGFDDDETKAPAAPARQKAPLAVEDDEQVAPPAAKPAQAPAKAAPKPSASTKPAADDDELDSLLNEINN